MSERRFGDYVSTTAIDWVAMGVATALIGSLIVSMVSDAALNVPLHQPLRTPVAEGFPEHATEIAAVGVGHALIMVDLTD